MTSKPQPARSGAKSNSLAIEAAHSAASAACVMVLASWILRFPSGQFTSRLIGDAGDPSLYIATWRWQWRSLSALDFANFWRGWFFYPNRWTLGYTEHILGWMPLYKIFEFLMGSAPAAYNFLVLTIFGANAVAGYVLGRYIGKSVGAGWLCAFLLALAPYRFTQLTHIHASSYFVVPLALVATDVTLRRPTRRHVVVLGLVVGAATLFSMYHWALICLVFPVFVAARMALDPRVRRLRTLPALGCAVAISVAVALPVSVQLLVARKEVRTARSLDEVRFYSTRWDNLIRPPESSVLYERFSSASLGAKNASRETNAFVGYSGLAILGSSLLVLIGRRRKSPPTAGRRDAANFEAMAVARRELGDSDSENVPQEGAGRLSTFLHSVSTTCGRSIAWLAASSWGFALAMGPEIWLGSRLPPLPGPYRLVAELPAVSQLRAVGRFSVMVYVMVAAAGAAAWLGAGRARSRVIGAIFRASLVAACLLWILEGVTRITYSDPVPRNATEARTFNPALALVNGPLVELPLYRQESPAGSVLEAQRLYVSSYFWSPRVNGYSGYKPMQYDEIVTAMESFPDESSMRALLGLGVRQVIVHYDEMVRYTKGGEEAAFGKWELPGVREGVDELKASLRSHPRLRPLYEGDTSGAYEIVNSSDSASASGDLH